MKFLIWVKSNYWRFTPNTWTNWYHHWKCEIKEKIYKWKHYTLLPWHNNQRCAICGGSGVGSKYNSYWNCHDCNGKGFVPRYIETKASLVCNFVGLRFDNKIKK